MLSEPWRGLRLGEAGGHDNGWKEYYGTPLLRRKRKISPEKENLLTAGVTAPQWARGKAG